MGDDIAPSIIYLAPPAGRRKHNVVFSQLPQQSLREAPLVGLLCASCDAFLVTVLVSGFTTDRLA